jgi:hypothetical protein
MWEGPNIAAQYQHAQQSSSVERHDEPEGFAPNDPETTGGIHVLEPPWQLG